MCWVSDGLVLRLSLEHPITEKQHMDKNKSLLLIANPFVLHSPFPNLQAVNRICVAVEMHDLKTSVQDFLDVLDRRPANAFLA